MPDPNRDAPESYRKLLTKIGGTIPGTTKPMWRVCLAEHCTRKTSGIMHNLPSGDVSIFAVDGQGKVHTQSPGGTITAGTFEIPRYPCEGWISERWFPGSTWGSPEEWSKHTSEDGTTLLCSEFPAQGDYFLVGGPWERIPEISDMEQAIQMWEESYRNRPTNLLAEYQRLMKLEDEKREQRRLNLEKKLEYMRQNELLPILKSGSLEAQRYRNELSESVGDRSHLGVVLDA